MALSSRIPDPHTHFKKDMFVLNFLTPKTLLRFSFRALLHFYLIDKGAELASATVPWHWLFFWPRLEDLL